MWLIFDECLADSRQTYRHNALRAWEGGGVRDGSLAMQGDALREIFRIHLNQCFIHRDLGKDVRGHSADWCLVNIMKTVRGEQ